MENSEHIRIILTCRIDYRIRHIEKDELSDRTQARMTASPGLEQMILFLIWSMYIAIIFNFYAKIKTLHFFFPGSSLDPSDSIN